MADKTDRQIALYAAIESISTYETAPADIPGRVLPVADAFYAWLTADPRQPDGATHPAAPAEPGEGVALDFRQAAEEANVRIGQPRDWALPQTGEGGLQPVDREALRKAVQQHLPFNLEGSARANGIVDAVLAVLDGEQAQDRSHKDKEHRDA